MKIEYNGKGQLINISVDDHESFVVAIDLIRQIATNQSTEEVNLEFLNELSAEVPKNENHSVGWLLSDDTETMDDLDELIDTTLYDNNELESVDDIELWLDIEDEIESDDDDFNIPRYVDVSEPEQIEYWNEVIDSIAAKPSTRYIDADDLICTPPELIHEYEDENAIEVPVILEPEPIVNLLPEIRVECPECLNFSKVDPLATTFVCEHCNKAQFTTKGHIVHKYHCPVCDKMNLISVCEAGMYLGECCECNDYHSVIIKSDGTVEVF